MNSLDFQLKFVYCITCIYGISLFIDVFTICSPTSFHCVLKSSGEAPSSESSVGEPLVIATPSRRKRQAESGELKT